jgi:hypothetical protein
MAEKATGCGCAGMLAILSGFAFVGPLLWIGINETPKEELLKPLVISGVGLVLFVIFAAIFQARLGKKLGVDPMAELRGSFSSALNVKERPLGSIDTFNTPRGKVLVSWTFTERSDDPNVTPEAEQKRVRDQLQVILDTNPEADLAHYAELLNVRVNRVERPWLQQESVEASFSRVVQEARTMMDLERVRDDFFRMNSDVLDNPKNARLRESLELLFDRKREELMLRS